ncbi:MAG TPA: pyrroline-5-carboxylate reductase [Actinomycetes bacterium]|nr:pyrroline-5-carboxylate reductase [Actinomycetes bacterium]
MSEGIAILGAGKMGEALLSGMLRAGRPASSIVVSTRDEARAKALRERHGVEVADNVSAVKGAATVVITVKPQDMGSLLDEIAPALSSDQLLVSVAAGITTSFIERVVPANTPVVRVMSNTPVLVDEAMSAISAGSHATEEHLEHTEDLLKPVGRTIRVPESQQDAVTALSGSGPAYFFYLVEAMTDAGILLGLPRSVAHDLIVQTAIGSAVMLRDSGDTPQELREAVMSPAGTTIAAIREMEDHKVRAAFLAALEAARNRSRELASGHE